ncbi:beta strand repeat-containing protein, partial [Flavobacterium reichenbachii]
MIRKLLLLIILIIFPTLTFGQTFTDNAVGTRTWTVPNGVTSITVEIWGGGGAGGGSQNGGRGGSGGGGGGYSTKLINVIPGQVISYTIGSGGTGGTGTGGNGNPSTLSHTQSSTTMSVGGGIGGKVSTNSGTVTGSAGGNASGGDTNRNGNTGDNAGGSAGAGGGSGPAPGANGGGAGSSGDGGDGSIGGGGGGGQRGSFSFTNRSGGNGGAGRVQFTYTTGAYKSRIISANTGSVTWCAGETRTVTVDIQNVGTATWVDGTGGAPDFNIGIKWNNGTGGSWDDYNVRVNAGNLASGATRTYTFNITASNNINTPQPGFPVTGYTTPLDGGTNNLTFDVVYEGVAWFGNNPAGVGPGNSTFTTPNQTIYPATPANRTTGSTAASVCPGTGTNITVANSEIGVSYQLRDAANNPIGLPVAGNNGTINLPTGNLASTTTFNVLAVGCSSSVQMTGTVTITVSSVTGTPVGTYLFCIDNTNSMATATVNSGQHVLVNVTKGFTYTFTVGDVFAGTTVSEYLAIFDGSNNAAIITNSGPSGTSIANWVSPFSGQIKILLSAGGTCSNSGTTGGAITLNLIGVNNTEDNQLVSGTNSWIGHVYNITGAPPATNASNAALINPSGLRGYVGYVTKAETFGIENFGGNTACYSTLSNGVNRSNIYTETFAVRYRMRSTKTGCYMVTVRGDDGVRLFVDGVSVFDAFTDHSTQTFGNVMVNLTGNSELVLDYYENGTVNEVSFDMVAFDNTTNTVTPASRTLCSGQTQLLDGSAYLYNGGANPTIKYQWQSSTNNAAFSDILGATTEDYTPPAETTTTTNTIYYYRRAVSATASNAGACIYYSNSVAITTSPGVPVFAAAATISGTAGQCNASTGQVYSIAAATNAVTYTWVLPTGWSITGGFGTNSITVTTGTTGQNGNITVVAVNGCGNSTPTKTLAVTVRALPTISSHPSTAGQTVCENTAITALSVAATAGSGTISDYKWYSNTTNSNTGGTLVATNTSAATTNTYTPANTTAGTLYYYVIVTNSNGCTVTSNVSGAITVNPIATLTLTTGTANQTVCAGTAISNTVYTWGGSATDVTVTNTIGLTVTKDLIAKTITISGIPTATGTYSIATTGQTSPCTAVSLSGNITVNPIATLALTTGTADQTICAGTAISSTVYTWGGSATDVTVTNTIGLTVVKNGPAKTVTISGTPTATGTYSIATNGQTSPCTAVSLSGNITVNPISTLTLTTGTANQTVCAGTAISNTVYTWGGSATDVTVTNTIGLTVTKNVAAKTVTISGTPTGGGTYSVVTTGHTSPCTAVSLSGTITVNPIATLALTTGTADQSVCAGTAISSTVYTWGGSATDVTVTNTIGLTVVKNATAKTVTISGTPTAGGTYSVATTGQTSPCTAISLSGTITVNPKPVAPTASVTKQPTCGDLTGTITISSPAPAAGITYSIDGTVFTNTTGVFTGLSAGAYNNIKVKNSSGCESNAASVTI